jgi:hypothetical protein
VIPALDAHTLWLLGAGMAGSFLRTWVTVTAETWSKRVAVETVLGGAGAVLLPSVPLFSGLSPWGQIVTAAVVSYAAADFTINFARQIAARFKG